MAPVTALKFVEVDARRIVNNSHVRVVTDEDVAVMLNSFRENGYIPTANPITVRVATAPEIISFYQREPHNYTAEKAREVTNTLSGKPDFDGHVYAYDGLIRKATVLKLWETHELPRKFTLRGMLVPQFSPRQAIAFGLAQKSVNGIAIKLSPLEVLLCCREYDSVFNAEKSTPANQTEVAKSMVNDSVPTDTPQSTKDKQAATRRQVIGVCRRIPDTAFNFLRSLLKTDVVSGRNAYTTANFKAIPKNLSEEKIVCLLKRFQKGYYRHMPKPKPFDMQEVKSQAALTAEAFRKIEEFNRRCEYDLLPEELNDLCMSMKSSQKYDEELEESESSEQLFPPLVSLCKKSVPGGDLLLKRIEEEDQNSSKPNADSLADGDLPNPSDVPPQNKTGSKSGSGKTKETRNTLDENKDFMGLDSSDANSLEDECFSEDQNNNLEAVGVDLGVHLPPNWIVDCYDFREFEKNGKEWDQNVSHKCDFATMRLPVTERDQAAIRKAITPWTSLHSTGVGHVFFTLAQYGLVENAVQEAGMYMARDGTLYIYNSAKIKRLTLAGQTQTIHQCGAVFWREPPSSSTKHHFSSEAIPSGSVV